MSAITSWTADYLLNAAWQIPVLFVAASLAAWLLRRAEARLLHRLWVGALVLEVLLPACPLSAERVAAAMAMTMATLRAWFAMGAQAQGAHVTALAGPGVVHGDIRATPSLLAAIVGVYALSVLFFATRLTVGLARTAALRRRAESVPVLRESLERHAQHFAVRVPELALSAEVAGPVTLGLARHVILFPAAHALDGEDVEAALAHEFAHIQRRDFARNLLYEALSLPAAFHPLLWLTRRRVAESREMACDAMAAQAVDGPQQYARSLLRLAAEYSLRAPAVHLHAMGIFEANTFENFERRMMKLTGKRMELRGVRRVASLALAMVVGAGACASALALRLQVASGQATPVRVQTAASPAVADGAGPILVAIPKPANGKPLQSFTVNIDPSEIAAAPTDPATNLKVVQPRDMASMQAAEATRQVGPGAMAGNLLTKVNPIYPKDAKAARIQGTVVLNAIIAKDGTIRELKPESGPAELQDSALTAVKQWVYRPYLLNGNPVEVETKISVTYSLSH